MTAIKIKMLRPYTWAVTGTVQQRFSVTLQGSDTIFDFCSSFYSIFFFFFCQLSLEATAQLCGLTPSFNLLHNVPPHCKKTKQLLFLCVYFCSLHLWRTCAWIVSLVCTDWPVWNPASILLLPEPPLALNNTSRHAVRDQLTLKLLDFTLKAVDEYRVLPTVLLVYAQTSPEGTWCWGKHGLSYARV